MASTRVVFPWSTCATIATLRRSERVSGMGVRRAFARWGFGARSYRRSDRRPASPATTRQGPGRRATGPGSGGGLRRQWVAAPHLDVRGAYAKPALACPEGGRGTLVVGQLSRLADPVSQAVLALTGMGTMGGFGAHLVCLLCDIRDGHSAGRDAGFSSTAARQCTARARSPTESSSQQRWSFEIRSTPSRP